MSIKQPDPKSAMLLDINMCLAKASEAVENRLAKGMRDYAAESWVEMASDLAHSLPNKKVICLKEGNEYPAFKNAKEAFPRSTNPLRSKPEELIETLSHMVKAARASTGDHSTDVFHGRIFEIMAQTKIIGKEDAKKVKAQLDLPDNLSEKSSEQNRRTEPQAQASGNEQKQQEQSSPVAKKMLEAQTMTLTLIHNGEPVKFPLMKCEDNVVVLQLNSHTGAPITECMEAVRDAIRKQFGENIAILQVYETNPESIKAITGKTGDYAIMLPWKAEVPGLKAWLASKPKV